MRYSVYRLRPDRRFIRGFDDYEDAKNEARARPTRRGESGFEVWDNEQGRPVFHVYRNKEGEVESVGGANR